MFSERLGNAIQASDGNLCVGLDPHRHLIPDRFARTATGIRSFLEWIIDETVEHACAFKPNSAFYEALGADGWQLLEHVIERVHQAGRPVILDAKRGDIASTAAAYATAAFEILDADAITLVAYMGDDAIVPFLEAGGFAFLLALPSNPSARLIVDHGTPSLFECVAKMAVELNLQFPNQVGLVVGATGTDAVSRLDSISADLPWLIPGLGAQGGQAEAFFAQMTHERMTVVNASRSILFAPEPRQAAAEMKREIREAMNG
ncbi:orotidine-5'-phosphate decarboxylase [Candidatus Bipolaricaulota bacterium]